MKGVKLFALWMVGMGNFLLTQMKAAPFPQVFLSFIKETFKYRDYHRLYADTPFPVIMYEKNGEYSKAAPTRLLFSNYVRDLESCPKAIVDYLVQQDIFNIEYFTIYCNSQTNYYNYCPHTWVMENMCETQYHLVYSAIFYPHNLIPEELGLNYFTPHEILFRYPFTFSGNAHFQILQPEKKAWAWFVTIFLDKAVIFKIIFVPHNSNDPIHRIWDTPPYPALMFFR